MVTLTRLTGMPFALNPDLIERVDETPDTVITLVDGTKYLVQESLQDVVAVVMDYRARLLASAGTLEGGVEAAERSARRLAAVPGPDDEQPAPREG
jgi:flagellar protein FlbD